MQALLCNRKVLPGDCTAAEVKVAGGGECHCTWHVSGIENNMDMTKLRQCDYDGEANDAFLDSINKMEIYKGASAL